MKPKPCTDPVWRSHDANRQPMTVHEFEFVDGSIGELRGQCRGLGPIGDDLQDHEDPIGLWDEAGTYYAIHVDTEGWQESPSFSIGPRVYHYPITLCMTMVGKVDPLTGYLLPPPPYCSSCKPIADQGLQQGEGGCTRSLWGCEGKTASPSLRICPSCASRGSTCQMCEGIVG